MASTKSICIVGAGPSGLVAAKTFLQYGGYTVTVYEAADRVGGMWRAQPGEFGDKCSPEMRTNLSRFTVAFADLPWSDVDLSNTLTGTPSPATPPMFPKAWQVGRYLEKYASEFNLRPCIFFNRRVVDADLLDDNNKWKITTQDPSTQQSDTQTFDHLIIASGFFDRPGQTFDPFPNGNSHSIIHSSKFRDLSSLSSTPGKIAVIGGGISGSEAAAQAAFQISSAKNSPGKSKPAHADSKVYHVVNRPFYCLPRYLPQNPLKEASPSVNPAPTFLPLDLILYNLSRRGDGEISASITTVPPEKAKKGHEFMRSVIGGDQQEYHSPALVHTLDQTQLPGYCGITDTYLEFVRSGLIVPVQGWVQTIERHNNDAFFDIVLGHKKPWSNDVGTESTLTDIAAVIEATGYKVGLDYLQDTVKSQLQYDTSCSRIPLLLARGSILCAIETLGFIGFYEGPYWGVMEMQARYIAKKWSKTCTDFSSSSDTTFNQFDVSEKMRSTLQSEHALQVPQFWMADYVGIVEEIAREGAINRADAAFGGPRGPIFPSRYQGTDTSEDASSVVQEVAGLLGASVEKAKFVAAAVFRGMQGIWSLRRNIATRNTTPGGVLTGTAQFHPRTPTDITYAAEYLYIEEGNFKMDNGFSFPATRRYIYRYNETTDKITAWFADEDGESTGAFFNTWDFHRPTDENQGWKAKGYHWCDPDTYKSGCEFKFRGSSLQTLRITYEVAGPKKDYSHESWYERPSVETRRV